MTETNEDEREYECEDEYNEHEDEHKDKHPPTHFCDTPLALKYPNLTRLYNQNNETEEMFIPTFTQFLNDITFNRTGFTDIIENDFDIMNEYLFKTFKTFPCEISFVCASIKKLKSFLKEYSNIELNPRIDDLLMDNADNHSISFQTKTANELRNYPQLFKYFTNLKFTDQEFEKLKSKNIYALYEHASLLLYILFIKYAHHFTSLIMKLPSKVDERRFFTELLMKLCNIIQPSDNEWNIDISDINMCKSMIYRQSYVNEVYDYRQIYENLSLRYMESNEIFRLLSMMNIYAHRTNNSDFLHCISLSPRDEFEFIVIDPNDIVYSF